MTLLKIVPMAFVMIAGPQIISSVMFATSERPRPNSLAYVAGATTSTLVGTTVIFFIVEALGLQSSAAGPGGDVWVEWLLVGLLAALGLKVFLGRKTSEPPKWMGRLQTATPGFALKLGLLLFIVMPTDILTMITVGTYLSSHNEDLLNAVPFVALTALLVALPLLALLGMGARAQTILPKLRDWMNANSWVVSEIVILFFLVMELKDALAG